MSARERLAERQQARVAWLRNAVEQWSDDPSVVGAWLWGSEGTGTADALSDYDLFVALSNAAGVDGLQAVESRFPAFGAVVWCRESEYNAPTGGRYFTVGYPAPVLPLGIDWYWQPESEVRMGTDTRVLVEKRRLRRGGEPRYALFPNVQSKNAYQHPDDARLRLQGRIRWFWSMYGAVGKWAARSHDARVEQVLPSLAAVVDEATVFVNRGARAREVYEASLVALRHLAVEMADLTALLEGAGVGT